MTPRFLAAVEFALRPEHEGRYSNDPRDKGGETNFGVSKLAYPDLPIALLSREEAIAIHYRDRWVPIHGDELPEGLGLLVFEASLNQGLDAAVTMLQEEINHLRRPARRIDVDGDLGKQTLAAIREEPHDDLVDRYAARRAWRYEINKQEELYGLGWFSRLFRAHREAVTG